MSTLLNPTLCKLLERHLGEVEVLNAGQPLIYDYVWDPNRNQERMVIVTSGEEYRVNCDICRETRQRLQINHRWYWHDSAHNQTWTHLIHCFNENCYAEFVRRDLLHTRLYSGASGRLVEASQPRQKPTVMPLLEAPTQELPGRVIDLRKLSTQHAAIRYLEGRYFDIDDLSRRYRVSYCEDSHYTYARERILIPAYADGRLVGWQARHIGELPWKDKSKAKDLPPKYFTCPGMPRGRVLYNLDLARKYSTVVIVEGPMDVWRTGPMAVGVWGSSLNGQQKKRLHKEWGAGSAVLLLDPDIMDPKSDRNRKIKLKNLLGMTDKFRGGLATVALPHGTDPGWLDRGWLRQYVTEQAHDQGVQVRWKRW